MLTIAEQEKLLKIIKSQEYFICLRNKGYDGTDSMNLISNKIEITIEENIIGGIQYYVWILDKNNNRLEEVSQYIKLKDVLKIKKMAIKEYNKQLKLYEKKKESEKENKIRRFLKRFRNE